MKAAIDPDFQNTDIIDQLSVIIDDVPDKNQTTGNNNSTRAKITAVFRSAIGSIENIANGSKAFVGR